MTKTKAKTKAPACTVITMVVDESGSMGHLQQATISGFNEYVQTLKKDTKNKAFFSALTFDTRGIRKLQVGADLKDAITLGHLNYQPTGGTPLFDAVAAAIRATDEVMQKHQGAKAIVVIQTDGEENSSQEIKTVGQIKAMIEIHTAKGWEFVFIGAGINAFAAGTSMGVAAINTVSYGADARSTKAIFAATGSNTQSLRSGMSATMGYSRGQTESAGESDDIWNAKIKASNALTGVQVVASININDLSLVNK